MDVNFDKDLAYTGGRDGSIFQSSLIENNTTKIYQHDQKQMITCLKLDNQSKKLWLGTSDSSTYCIDLKQLKDNTPFNKDITIEPFMAIDGKFFYLNSSYKKGLPWITDYYILKNKRYVLTLSSDKTVELWSMESGTVVKKWINKTFQQI